MTANDIYILALSFLSETPSGNALLEGFTPGWLSLLLEESRKQENHLRRFEGRPELEQAPVVTDLSQEIDYHEAILRTALPYGLASFFFLDDENDYRSQDFRARYISALNDAVSLREEPVRDLYGGDGDA